MAKNLKFDKFLFSIREESLRRPVDATVVFWSVINRRLEINYQMKTVCASYNVLLTAESFYFYICFWEECNLYSAKDTDATICHQNLISLINLPFQTLFTVLSIV